MCRLGGSSCSVGEVLVGDVVAQGCVAAVGVAPKLVIQVRKQIVSMDVVSAELEAVISAQPIHSVGDLPTAFVRVRPTQKKLRSADLEEASQIDVHRQSQGIGVVRCVDQIGGFIGSRRLVGLVFEIAAIHITRFVGPSRGEEGIQFADDPVVAHVVIAEA